MNKNWKKKKKQLQELPYKLQSNSSRRSQNLPLGMSPNMAKSLIISALSFSMISFQATWDANLATDFGLSTEHTAWLDWTHMGKFYLRMIPYSSRQLTDNYDFVNFF